MRIRICQAFLALITCVQVWAQVPYSYAPSQVGAEEVSALGAGTRSDYVQGLTCFDPATDPAFARMQGYQILGIRVYMRADYKQARQRRSAILASVGKPENIVNTTYADFSEGWNDVLFDEPLIIGTEPIYLGAQVYETVGTPYPLVAYAAATVPQSTFVNLGKKQWEEYADRGTLLIAALMQDEVADVFARTAYAQNTTHPQTVAPDADFEGGLYIHNFSDSPLTSIEVAMQGDGSSPVYRSLDLETPLQAYGSTVVNTRLYAGAQEGTSVPLSISVTKVNGEDAQEGRAGVTRLFVTKDNFIRTPLVEEFTSQRCVNCPQMAYFLEKAFSQYNQPYVYLAHHSGFAYDTFTSETDREVVYVFGGYNNEYNPAIMFDRTVFEGSSTIVYGILGMSAQPYLDALAYAAQMPAKAEIALTHDETTVTVSGRVAHDLVGTPLYLSCLLVEDGIGWAQYPQDGMDDADAPADLREVFRHNGVILHHFNSAALGDPIEAASDGTFSQTYPLVEAAGFGGTARRIVAFVHQINKDNLRENEVLNATQTYLYGAPDGIGGVEAAGASGKGVGSGIYTLLGQRLSSSSSRLKGVYVIGGRKVAF